MARAARCSCFMEVQQADEGEWLVCLASDGLVGAQAADGGLLEEVWMRDGEREALFYFSYLI